MPKPRRTLEDKKNEFIDGLVTARRAVLAAVQSLPANRMDEIFLGTWTVKDLLAHLAGWDFTNLQAVQEILAGQRPTFFRYFDQDWHTYNQQLVEQYRIEPWPALWAEVNDSHEQLISFLRGLSAQELVNGKTRSEKGRTVTIRNLLLSEAGDERRHAEQVAAFRAQERVGGPPALRVVCLPAAPVVGGPASPAYLAAY
jgi:hypothetical protein